MFGTLDPERLCVTVDKMRDQVEDTFPCSGLARVGQELSESTRYCIAEAEDLKKPLWGLRAIVMFAVSLLLIWPLVLGWFMEWEIKFESFAEFLEATDAGVHMLLVAAGGILFLITVENRIKRNRALEDLKTLRSMAHIIDMHQIAKDPGLDYLDKEELARSTRTVKSDGELALYLDFCSDLLALIGKLAAYYLQSLNDREVLNAVGEIESLTNGLSSKVWQKIRTIGHIADSVAQTRAAQVSKDL